MRLLSTFVFIAMAQSAQAHSGHLGDLAGHDHWVAGAAIGVAIALGIWGVLKGEKEPSEPTDSETNDEEATA